MIFNPLLLVLLSHISAKCINSESHSKMYTIGYNFAHAHLRVNALTLANNHIITYSYTIHMYTFTHDCVYRKINNVWRNNNARYTPSIALYTATTCLYHNDNTLCCM